MAAGFQKPSYFGGPVNYAPVTPPNPNAPIQKTYRSDAGQNLTDAEYFEWQRQQPLRNLQSQTDIQTAAQKGLAEQKYGQERGLAQQGFGFQKELAGQQGDIATAARTQASDLSLKQEQAEAGLQAAAEQRRLGYIPQVAGQLNSSLGISGPNSAAPSQVNLGDLGSAETAAQGAALARAKDVAGQTGRSALTALQNVMGARGLAGTPFAGGQAANIIGESARQVGDVNRENLIQSLNLARQRASEAYQGAIAQRGQDIGLRGQNLQASLSLANPLLGLITARY